MPDTPLARAIPQPQKTRAGMYTKDEDIGRKKAGIGGKMKLIMIIGGMAQGKHAFAAQFTHARCIDGLAAQIRDAVRAGRDPLAEANASIRDLITGREDIVLIYPEVGSGVVPLDPEERAWREAVGRVGCRIAAEADEVYRMVAGIAQRIK